MSPPRIVDVVCPRCGAYVEAISQTIADAEGMERVPGDGEKRYYSTKPCDECRLLEE